MKRTALITAFSALALGCTVATAYASIDVNYLKGSRADVRAYCVGDDAVLSERNDYSMCIRARGATFMCYDDGDCIRTGDDLTTGSIPTPRPSQLIPHTGPGGLQIIQ
jgi:hypothetical protein